MEEKSGWELDIPGTSSKELVEILKELEGSPQKGIQFRIKCELVERARKRGNTDEQIIRKLFLGVPRGEPQNKLAREWAKVFGLSEKEFKQI